MDQNVYDEAIARFRHANLASTADFLIFATGENIQSIGTIREEVWLDALKEIRDQMKDVYNVYSSDEGVQQLQRPWIDPTIKVYSFYFGGYRLTDDLLHAEIRVTEYLLLLSYVVDTLSDGAKKSLERFSEELLQIRRSVH